MSNENSSPNINTAAAENAGNSNNNEDQPTGAATTIDPVRRSKELYGGDMQFKKGKAQRIY